MIDKIDKLDNQNETPLEVFDQRAQSRINNSIFCLDDFVSGLENQFGTPWLKWENFCKRRSVKIITSDQKFKVKTKIAS